MKWELSSRRDKMDWSPDFDPLELDDVNDDCVFAENDAFRRRLVGAKFNNYKHKLKDKLQKVAKLALTTDLWKSNSSNDHIAITGHYFNKKFEYQSTILGF